MRYTYIVAVEKAVLVVCASVGVKKIIREKKKLF